MVAQEQVEVGFEEARRGHPIRRRGHTNRRGVMTSVSHLALPVAITSSPPLCSTQSTRLEASPTSSSMRPPMVPRLMKPRFGGSPFPRTLAARRRYSALTSNWDEPLAVSDELTQQKSAFQAYATRCRVQAGGMANTPSLMKTSVVPQLLAHIQGVDPHTRRASHAMYAWRVRPTPAGSTSSSASPSMVLFGSSNGGEAGAGERLERLLELGNCEDVILVVFRWYGGVKLGSDRWRCISAVAKEALDRGGFLARREGESGRDGGKNGGRKRGR